MKKCFDFECYKEFLLHVEEFRAPLQRGFRTKLAESIGIQNAYISKVLNGEAQLSLEQGLRLCRFLNLEESERQYVLWLIEQARAGTQELKSFFGQLLGELRERHLNLSENVGKVQELTTEAQVVYYSQWHYAAIHAIVSIPGMQSADHIAQVLRLGKKQVKEALLFLVECGILEQHHGRLRSGKTQLHLDRMSPNIFKHHTNWRIRAIEALGSADGKSIHYSTVSSLSAKDVEKLRSKIVKLVQEYVETVRQSPEEVLYSFAVDFYSLAEL